MRPAHALQAAVLASLSMAGVNVAARLLLGAPTFFDLFEDPITRLMPVHVFAFLIDHLQDSAKPLLFAGLLLLQIIVGIALGWGGLSLWVRFPWSTRLPSIWWGPAYGCFLFLTTGAIVLPLSGQGAFGAAALDGPIVVSATLLGSYLVFGAVLSIRYPVVALKGERRDEALKRDDGVFSHRLYPGLERPGSGLPDHVVKSHNGQPKTTGQRVGWSWAGRLRPREAPATVPSQHAHLPGRGDGATAESGPRRLAGRDARRSAVGTIALAAVALVVAAVEIRRQQGAVRAPVAGPPAAPVQPPVAAAAAAGRPAPGLATPLPARSPSATVTPASAIAPLVARIANPTAVVSQSWQIPGLAPLITPVGSFYIVTKNLLNDPTIAPEKWTLQLSGSVEHPLRLSYADLLAVPAVELYLTLECVSNPVGGNEISTAWWRGVLLSDLLTRAGVKKGARSVVFHAVDGYAERLPIQRAWLPINVVAYHMNGQPLPREHGAPARMLLPGKYGFKNVKWVTAIEVIDRDFTGYWEERGYSDEAQIQPTSRIDVPPEHTSLVAGPITIAGIAFSGDRGISRVRLSTDSGKTWNDAELERSLGPYAWRRWRQSWHASPGGHLLNVQAYDATGTIQWPLPGDSTPDGATGLDTKLIQIARS